ncbi:low temperature requirement protein A [Arthrobacter ginkgonis]|uniref:Low temperature requirement protein A n=1 Tax=Arthrobacter ginkgonis TaxID=1630594 RepID=A0ABP7CF14_9MICC
MSRPARPRFREVVETSSATTLELFFDLVFVFALTQVTATMAHDLSAAGVLRGLCVTAILWWCWVCFSWVANVVKADEGPTEIAMFAGMGGMLVMALSIPEAFEDLGGGFLGPLVFALGYLVVRLVHLILFAFASKGDPALRKQVSLFAVTMCGSTLLLLAAAPLDGTAESLLWAGVILVDYGGTLLIGNKGWRVRSAKHFAERHGLIVIVAIGESIVAIGVGMSGTPVSWPVLAASLLGLTVSASIWWAYFNRVSADGEHQLAVSGGRQRTRMAQLAYTYLHLPMVAGIVLAALGMKKVLEYVSDSTHHSLAEGLSLLPAAALLGGTALFLAAHAAFARAAHTVLGPFRLVVAGVLVLAIPAAQHVPALAAIGGLSVVLVALNLWESFRGPRAGRTA